MGKNNQIPTLQDMKISLEDARFFYKKLETIVRGPEQRQNLELIRRYFRAYLHCWKSIVHFVKEVKGLVDPAWSTWCNIWQKSLQFGDRTVFEYLRKTRDYDTHMGMIDIEGEIAAGLNPIVMFQPGKQSGPRTDLISCCERGLHVVQQLIKDHPNII